MGFSRDFHFVFAIPWILNGTEWRFLDDYDNDDDYNDSGDNDDSDYNYHNDNDNRNNLIFLRGVRVRGLYEYFEI